MEIKKIISEIENHIKSGAPMDTTIPGNEHLFELAFGQLIDEVKSQKDVAKLMALAKELKLFQHKNRGKNNSRVA